MKSLTGLGSTRKAENPRELRGHSRQVENYHFKRTFLARILATSAIVVNAMNNEQRPTKCSPTHFKHLESTAERSQQFTSISTQVTNTY